MHRTLSPTKLSWKFKELIHIKRAVSVWQLLYSNPSMSQTKNLTLIEVKAILFQSHNYVGSVCSLGLQLATEDCLSDTGQKHQSRSFRCSIQIKRKLKGGKHELAGRRDEKARRGTGEGNLSRRCSLFGDKCETTPGLAPITGLLPPGNTF